MNTTALPFGLSLLRLLPVPGKLGLLERLYGNRLSRKGPTWITTSTGINWKLDLENPCHRWIVYGDYEGPVQMNWVRSWLKGGGTVIDSGANIGQTLIYFLSAPETRVICIEPLPMAVEWLNECIAEGGFADRTSVLNILLDDHEGTTQLKLAGPAHSKEWSTIHLDWFEGIQTRTINCAAQTLDNLLQRRNNPVIRLWKLDVEGGEERALHGATKSLGDKKIEALLVELYCKTLDNVVAFMWEHGYEPHSIKRGGSTVRIQRLDVKDLSGGNCLFLPS